MEQNVEDSALFAAVLDAAVDAIIVCDEDGTIVRANRAAHDLFRYGTDALVGKSVNMLMPLTMAQLHDDFMQNYDPTSESRVIGQGREVEGLRKDQSTFPLNLSVGETRIGGKRTFIGILHDLSQFKATQAALERSQRLDAIGQMTGGIAHDFNNLLTVVIGNLELLEKRGADARQEMLIRDALEAAELGSDLTRRLLVFARKGNLKPVKSDLKALCKDTLAILERTIGSSYHITTDFAPDLHEVMIDPVQLQSALMNLALNARDAMGPSGELLFSLANVSIDDTYMAQETDITEGEYVRMSVSDNGAGMSIEAQQRAFEPFFSTKSETSGTGLGLAMVYGFVRQSGGHVTLYSELGLGSSFALYFPAIQNHGNGSEISKGDKDSVPVSGRGQIVMIVEDNPKVRKLSIERIRDLGFQTEEATSGDDAYQMLKNGSKADIVFSDLVMPGSMNGYDLAARVEVEFPQIKVLLTSGYASDVVTGTMAHDRAYDILHKPYRQSDLGRRLHALLEDTSVD
ncbi:PAS domain S-box protein [Sulfitobacter sp. JB4-11]|uniref:PAS domain S-box protein n=1 Tax=Sulfitobacter rhodophyticola TaxID=3238304 RepID=UPI0035134C7C